MLGKPFPFLGHQMVQITFLGGLSGSRSSGDPSRPCPHVPVGCSVWAGQKLNCGVTHRSCPPLLGLGREGQPWIPRWTTRRQDLHCTALSGITQRSRNYPVEILGASSPRAWGLAQEGKVSLGNFHLSSFLCHLDASVARTWERLRTSFQWPLDVQIRGSVPQTIKVHC